jgi:hypothetical protein
VEFTEFWMVVQGRLQPGQRIRNWTAAKGFLGDDFKVVLIEPSHVEVDSPNAETMQRVSKNDFRIMFDHWSDYCSGRVKRSDLVKLTRVSKYTMSILRHLDVPGAHRIA